MSDKSEATRLATIIKTLHRRCQREMEDLTKGPSETMANLWEHVEHAASEAEKGGDE